MTADLEKYIMAGRRIQALYHAAGESPKEILATIDCLLSDLKQLGFGHAESFMAPLMRLRAEVEDGWREHPDEELAITHTFAEQIRLVGDSIATIVNSEARQMHFVVRNRGVVGARLRAFLASTADSHHKDIIAEAILCLECGAWRAAVVMGWNLTYEFFRQWLFKKHLMTFNAELPNWNKKHKARPLIADYTDFAAIPESGVIEIARDAGLITRDHAEVLFGGLRERNQCAHPSTVKVDPTIAAGTIAKLVANILEDAKFA